MKSIHTILREDFGALDPNIVRTELLTTAGVRNVAFEHTGKGLAIEYDPEIITPSQLIDLLCRSGLYPTYESIADARAPNEG